MTVGRIRSDLTPPTTDLTAAAVLARYTPDAMVRASRPASR